MPSPCWPRHSPHRGCPGLTRGSLCALAASLFFPWQISRGQGFAANDSSAQAQGKPHATQMYFTVPRKKAWLWSVFTGGIAGRGAPGAGWVLGCGSGLTPRATPSGRTVGGTCLLTRSPNVQGHTSAFQVAVCGTAELAIIQRLCSQPGQRLDGLLASSHASLGALQAFFACAAKNSPPVSGWTGEVCGWQAPPAQFESRPTW